jgi:serine/threonine protein kinase
MANEPNKVDSETTLQVSADELASAPPAILGHFELGRMLGSGGMGMVFAARDVVLDRQVALKLVRPDAARTTAHARLLREGQALARLAHANVTTVYEIGSHGGIAFIVMELVAGTTLREWMKEEHGWREIVRVFAAAGRGLAAAHALGLVHRDFKPSNVLIDNAGAVKVSDFGLVGASEDTLPEGALNDVDAGAALTLTRPGAVVGTPAYMAPEQVRGERIDALADQFAFCASLHEALSGALPQAQEKATRTLPRRLRPIVARGLLPDAAERYPSMQALLIDLERVVAPRRWPWIAAGVVAATVMAGLVVRRPDPCPRPRLDRIWGQARQRALRDHLAAHDPAQGAARFDAVAAAVDPYVRAIADMHVEACRATHVLAKQSDTLLDLRMRCLDRRREELASALALLTDASDVVGIDRAVAALTQLTPLGACADAAALTGATPETPRERQAADAIARDLVAVDTARRAGRPDGLLARAQALLKRADELDHAPSQSTALATLGEVQLDLGDSGGAAATFQRLTQVAARARDDLKAAHAWTKLVSLIGYNQGKPKEGLALVPVARASILRAGDGALLRYGLLYAEAIVLDESGKPKEALARLDEARRANESDGAAAGDGSHLLRVADLELESAMAHEADQDFDGGAAAFYRAIAAYRRALGPDHPYESYAWHDLGSMLSLQTGKLEEALAASREAVRIREARLGEVPLLSRALISLGWELQELQRWDESLVVLERAVRIDRQRLAPRDAEIATPLRQLALTQVHLGRYEDAQRSFNEAIALHEQADSSLVNLPMTFAGRGWLFMDQSRYREALADCRHARELFDATPATRGYLLIFPLACEGAALVRLGRAREAIAPLERTVSVKTPGIYASYRATARVYLGRALIESGSDPTRGLALVRAGRDELKALGPAAANELRDANDWLSRYARTH